MSFPSSVTWSSAVPRPVTGALTPDASVTEEQLPPRPAVYDPRPVAIGWVAPESTNQTSSPLLDSDALAHAAKANVLGAPPWPPPPLRSFFSRALSAFSLRHSRLKCPGLSQY